jgi:perosamine synthetase
MIPLSVPTLGGREREYVAECLETNWVSYLGPFVDRFERELAGAVGARHAVATSSGTAALHLALMAMGVSPDSEVVMPGMSFVAPGNAVRYCGAWPTFVDLNPHDWQIDLEKLDDFFARGCARTSRGLENKATGRAISALLAVDLLGDVGDVDGIWQIASRYDLPVVEDAAECLGATYKKRPIGAAVPGCADGRRLIITSFNGNKIVTCGGGGAVFTENAQIAAQIKHLSTTARTDSVRFLHDQVGYNYRLTNVAAAIGVAQLERLGEFVAAKRGHAARYRDAFCADRRITCHPESRHTDSIFWLYTVLLESDAMPAITVLNELGIQARPAWTPLYELPQFSGCYAHRCEFTAQFARRAVSLPSSVSLTRESQDRVIEAVLSLVHE